MSNATQVQNHVSSQLALANAKRRTTQVDPWEPCYAEIFDDGDALTKRWQNVEKHLSTAFPIFSNEVEAIKAWTFEFQAAVQALRSTYRRSFAPYECGYDEFDPIVAEAPDLCRYHARRSLLPPFDQNFYGENTPRWAAEDFVRTWFKATEHKVRAICMSEADHEAVEAATDELVQRWNRQASAEAPEDPEEPMFA